MKYLYIWIFFLSSFLLPPFSLQAQYAYQMQVGSEAFNLLQFSDPEGVATDTQGNVYVANTRGHQIIKLDANGEVIFKFGNFGYGDGELFSPAALCVDATGNIYVAEISSNRIQKFDATGKFLLKFGTYGNGDGQFYSPQGIAVDAMGNIYVADGQNHRIQKFNANGVFVMKIGGPSYGSANGQFYNPSGVAIDAAGNIYVSELYNNRIQKFNSAGVFLMSIGGDGYLDGQFSYPTGVAIDSQGNIYVSDQYNNRVQKFSPTGAFMSKWGTKGTANGQFVYPQAIALDPSGNILVVDQSSFQKFSPAATCLWRRGSSTLDGQLNTPYHVTVDAQGNIYVSDFYNDRIQKFNSNGAFTAKFGITGTVAGQLDGPRAIQVDGTGSIIMADYYNNRVQKFSSSGQSLMSFGSFGVANGQFNNPCGLSLDANGNIFVLGYNGNNLQKFSSSGVFQWKIGGTVGTSDGQFYYPTAIATDAQGNVYVADEYNHRIQKFNTNGGFVMKFGSQGSGTGQFKNPQGIALDASGNIYVTDYNHRVQKFSAGGVFIASFGSRGNATGQFQDPSGLHIDTQGNIYVADRGNHRIQKFVPAPEVFVKVNNVLIANQTGEYNLMATSYGTALMQTFTIDNSLGLKTVSVGNLALPAGYQLSGDFPALIQAGATANFTLILPVQPAGFYNGQVTFTTSDPDKPIYSFTIKGQVLKLNQIISFTLPFKSYGDEPFLLTGTSTSNLPIVFSSSNPAVATITDNVMTIIGAGSTTIHATQAGNENYHASTTSASYTVSKAYVSLSWSHPADIVYGTPLGSAQLKAQAIYKNTPIQGKYTYTPAEGTILEAAAGQYLTVNFTPDDGVNFNPSAQVVRINVGRATQTITFAALADRPFSAGPITLSAQITSGLPLTYAVSQGPATAQGNTLTLTGSGTVVVTVYQLGDNNYHPAPSVEVRFCVSAGQPVIEARGSMLISSSLSGNQWYLNNNPILGATGQEFIATIAGEYKVGVRGLCGSEAMSEVFSISVSGVNEEAGVNRVKIYPNPASTHFTVELPKDKIVKQISLLDSKGGKVLSKRASVGSSISFVRGDLPKGVYMLSIETATEVLYRKVVIH